MLDVKTDNGWGFPDFARGQQRSVVLTPLLRTTLSWAFQWTPKIYSFAEKKKN